LEVVLEPVPVVDSRVAGVADEHRFFRGVLGVVSGPMLGVKDALADLAELQVNRDPLQFVHLPLMPASLA
jgi:hypothetical protein